MTEGVVIFVTTSSKDEAKAIAEALVSLNLVACANILDSVQSIFRWEGKLCEENEVLMVLKSVKSRLEQVVQKVRQLHSYDLPEIIALPIVGGSEDYLKWVESETL